MGIILLTLYLNHRNDLLLAGVALVLVATNPHDLWQDSPKQSPVAWIIKFTAEIAICVGIFQQTDVLPEWFIPG
jgi:hypothetical protein